MVAATEKRKPRCRGITLGKYDTGKCGNAAFGYERYCLSHLQRAKNQLADEMAVLRANGIRVMSNEWRLRFDVQRVTRLLLNAPDPMTLGDVSAMLLIPHARASRALRNVPGAHRYRHGGFNGRDVWELRRS